MVGRRRQPKKQSAQVSLSEVWLGIAVAAVLPGLSQVAPIPPQVISYLPTYTAERL